MTAPAAPWSVALNVILRESPALAGGFVVASLARYFQLSLLQ
jgi:hypothetical protein